MKNGLKIYQKEIFNDDFKKKTKRLRTVVLNNLQLTDIQLLKFLKLLNCHETAMRF